MAVGEVASLPEFPLMQVSSSLPPMQGVCSRHTPTLSSTLSAATRGSSSITSRGGSVLQKFIRKIHNTQCMNSLLHSHLLLNFSLPKSPIDLDFFMFFSREVFKLDHTESVQYAEQHLERESEYLHRTASKGQGT